MKTIKAFFLGIYEFRLSFTAHYEDFNLSNSYDIGREFAHKLTLRKFDN